MVEVSFIAEGVSGLTKTYKRRTVEERHSCTRDYYEVAKKTISRMQADNQREHNRIRPRDIRRMIMRQLRAGDPTTPKEVLETLVDQLLPNAMATYNGPVTLVHAPSEQIRRIKADRDQERRRVVRANRTNRTSESMSLSVDRMCKRLRGEWQSC